MMRVTRLTAVKNALGWEMTGTEKELLASGCFQFGSHASGDVGFGPDGKLYASAGEGASFDTLDYGQYLNPCADPGDEGGSLRSQDFRSTSDALGVDGTIVKMDPGTGFTPAQATANSWLVAYGQRNPWRLTFRPARTQRALVRRRRWQRVGGGQPDPRRDPGDLPRQPRLAVLRGQPHRLTGAAGLERARQAPVREPLRAGAVGGHRAVLQLPDPGSAADPGRGLPQRHVLGLGHRVRLGGQQLPGAQYKGAMFFSDYARSCVWVLGKKPNGDPDPTVIQPVRAGRRDAGGPGARSRRRPLLRRLRPRRPGRADGERRRRAPHRLHGQQRGTDRAHRRHPDLRCGTAERSASTAPRRPTRTATPSPTRGTSMPTAASRRPGPSRRSSTPSAPTTSVCGSTTATATRRLRPSRSSPATPLRCWARSPRTRCSPGRSGRRSTSRRRPTTHSRATLPASAFSWNLAIRHCPSDVCHTHNLSTFPGVSSGSFHGARPRVPVAPPADVTVTDSGGLTDSRTVQLNPKTVALSFASSPDRRRRHREQRPVTSRRTPRRSSRARGSPSPRHPPWAPVRARPRSPRGPTAAPAPMS